MEKVNWKVEGMSCTNCALTIHKYLEGEGLDNVKVNFIGGDVSFELPENAHTKGNIEKGIEGLGYHVTNGEGSKDGKPRPKRLFAGHLQRFWFCLVFTLPLMIHMIPGVHIHFLMNHWVQLALTLPVYLVGMDFFGRSAIKSLVKGIPNMNVLVALGATAAFVYSLIGTFSSNPGNYLFYETTATILTLVFLGNWMEDKSVETTQASIRKLTVSQKIMANMIAYDEAHNEHIFPVESTHLKVGDLLLIKSGEYVPMDSKILSGNASVNEAIITGESAPVEKKMNDKLIGGSMLENGSVKVYVTAVGEDTVMSHILKMVKEAQAEKPPVQQLADRISAIFVPVVLGIAFITLAGNWFIGQHTFTESLLRSIAVLVIACPCAMGLATPAAIAVGLGRAARNGVLFKNARSLEVFRNIQQVVFDKTGTLTTGSFALKHWEMTAQREGEQPAGTTADTFKKIAFSLEKYSNHPIARCIAKEWKSKDEIRWAKMEEIKGLGMQGTDKEGNTYTATSFKGVRELTQHSGHNIYITRNNQLLGWIDVADDIRPEARQVVNALHARGIKTILLSGDSLEKCNQVAQALGIEEVVAEQTPEGKLERIAAYNQQAPVAMIGDGINDAPALARATVGISLSDASQIAMQSAQVVLMNHGLQQLPLALGLGKHTYKTIQQNLFWAFIYNIIAIPVAAFGFLSPTFGALVMGLSDVVLAINSVRLNWKKVA
ncbi:Cu+-exporting ATPase [Filimonas lacunae]|uniref:Cu+-exporting ATPase n=1 Tax=Filimonas lacunae TaxID=477680 RepID=A0A173MRY9_9BACT|nr:cation-translocating P-type ATPase [Filimonas lacunae]BAV10151.1 lead, cadmium, zinc and mercury transporting ATPase [Filimonas lacunae]SIT18806.1 Cu+-exporting ATPase [Filimonas lacunae]